MEMKPRQSKAVRRRNRMIKYIVVIVVIAALLVAAVFYGRQRVSETFGTSGTTEVSSAEVSTGSIIATVSGSGTLTSNDIEDVTIPSSVEIDTVYVSAGDTVEVGDALASIDTDSVLSALADVQTQLDELDAELEEASEDAVSSTVTAGVAGRIKVIYAEAGDDVSTVMYTYGALMIMSLDGYMGVEIEADGYEVGDSVTVTTSDGTEYTGTVSSVVGSIVNILVTDNGPTYGDEVTVDDSYTGTLYINEPLKVTGYAGTVSSVSVSENTKVSTSTTLLKLTDTAYSANYNQILAERVELEETFQTLIRLYKDGAIYAPISGSIESVPSTSSGSSSSAYGMTTTSSSSSETTAFTINPNETMSISISVDETNILSIELGQEVTVSVESIGDDTYSGTVSNIDTTASSGSGVTTYTVTITVDKVSGMMEGMTASASITIEGVENALILPESAVQNTSSTSYVYTSYDETTGELGDMVEVTTGLSNGSYIEIIDGLEEGDTVYYTTSSSDSSFGDFSSMGGMTDMNSFNTGGGMTDMGGGTSMPSGGGNMTMPGGN